MFIQLPSYEVTFTCVSGEELVKLKCFSEDELQAVTKVLVRSGFGSFQVERHDPPTFSASPRTDADSPETSQISNQLT